MTRVISNTFSITAQKDVMAARSNLVHCSLFQQDRLGWWELPYNASMSFVEYGRYGYEGYNAYGVLAKPGQISDLKQCLAITKKDSVADYNKEGSNIFALQGGKWYTLSFNALGNGRKFNSDGTLTGENTNESTMYVYLVGRTDTGYVSVVDSSAGYIVDGVNKTVPHDLSTPIKIRWQWESHTITFKTSSAIAAIPMLFIRSFGQGYNDEFADGGCLYRIACVKLEEGMEATAFTPHATELQPPVHAVAFRRTNENQSKAPEGGTYNYPTPTGWSDGIPAGSERLWETKGVFYPELNKGKWTIPSPVGDTETTDVEFSPYVGIPSTPSSSNLAPSGTTPDGNTNTWFDPVRNSDITDWSMMVWRAERQTVNGVAGSWVITKIKGEDGTSFTAKGSVEKHYASLTDYNNDSTKVTGKYYIVDTTPQAVMYKYGSGDAIACEDGDAYTTSDLHLWVKSGAAWHDLGKIQGPQGPSGPKGEDGISYSLVPSHQYIPVDSNGCSTISSIKLVAKKYKGSDMITDNAGDYSIVAHVFYAGSQGVPQTQSTNKSSELSVSIDPTKPIQKITCSLNRGMSTPVSFDLMPLANGAPSLRLDLDNEMDSVVCDSNGYLLNDTTLITTLRFYEGGEQKGTFNLEGSDNANTTIGSFAHFVPHEVSTEGGGSQELTIKVTFNRGTHFSVGRDTMQITYTYNGSNHFATFTVNALRNGQDGENGEPAISYNVVPSLSVINLHRYQNNVITPSYVNVSCNVVKSSGGITSVISSGDSVDVKWLFYMLSSVNSWTRISIGESVRVSSSDEWVKFCLSTAYNAGSVNDSNIVDIETVPVVIDGQNGSNGSNGADGADGVSIDFFASANTIMMSETGVEPSSITFKATMAYGDGEPSAIWSSTYLIVVSEYDSNGKNTETNNYDETHSYSCDYTHSISNTTTLTKLVAELQKNDTVIRTLTIPVVKKGADGRSYNPVPRGIWTSGETYKWDDKQRDYVDCEISGVYYRFGVRTYDTEVTDKPTSDQGDENWEVCNRVSCLITNCVFGTNAVIGGFVVTAGKFMSTENAYALRYMRLYEEIPNKVNYRGSYSGGISYSQNDAVYHNGSYYYSKISGNTATPSGSSNWASCSSLLIERIKEAGVGTVYLYEYDNATLKRPVVQDGGTYYTIKKMGAATTRPTASNSNWRELTDNELSFLSVGTGSETTSILSYVPKYTLNGNNGTVIMIQADDTCWTYDDTGRQVNGIPYGKRVEIVPASKSIDVYDETGELALQVNGDTYDNVNKAYGSGTITPSCVTNSVEGSLSSDSNGSVKTMQSLLSSDSAGYFEVKDYPLNLSVTCAFSLNVTELRTTATPSGNYGPILSVPRFEGNQWVYRNDCQGAIVVQKQNADGVTWGNHNQLVSVSTSAKSGTVSRYSDTLSCILQPGKYRLVFVFTASLFGTSNHGYSSTYSYCSFNVTYIKASGNYEVKTSRVFANGLAFGSATNDNFVVVRESGGIHVKASTKSGHGFELSQTKGLEVKRDGYQGAALPVLFVARTTYLSENAKKEYEYLYWNEALGKPTMTWTARGVCEIILGSDYPTSEHIMPTLTSYAAPEMGVSARIKSWSGQKIIIELDSDYNSPNDYGGFYIKLEYIG